MRKRLRSARPVACPQVAPQLRGHWAGAPATHQPHHEVGEHSDPQSGRDEGDHEELLPAGLAAVGDGDTQEEDERPSEHPFSLVAFCLCKGVWDRAGSGRERKTWGYTAARPPLLYCFKLILV